MTREYFGFDFDAHIRSLSQKHAARPGDTAGVVAAVRLDGDGRIVSATADAAALLGYAPHELRGRTLVGLAAEGWRAAAEGVTARIVAGALESCELLLAGRSGRRTLVRMSARPIDDGDEGDHVVGWTKVQGQPALASVPDRDEMDLRRLAYDLLSTQEAERTRVASELHGGVAPLVIMAKFMVEDALQRLMRGAYSEATDVLINVTGRLRDVIGEVRRISMELRPSLLDDLGLLPTIEWFCRHCEQAYRTLRVERIVEVAEADIPETLKLEIFRIIEEAVSNAAQHANAKSVRVSLRKRGDELELTIVDDGSGFEAAQLFYGNACLLGVGLQGIKRRVEGTNGRLLLESTPMSGTVVGAVWKLDRGVGAAA
ncbi:MAG: ATP-binding protein [Burkholderiaceae bacterium]